MKREDLYQLIRQPVTLSQETIPGLREMVDQYPYFHTARILYLKNLADTEDQHFGSELKRMAIGVPDRKKLFFYIENLQPEELSDQKKEKENPGDPFHLIDSFLAGYSFEKKNGENQTLEVPPSVSGDYIYWAYQQGIPEEIEDPEEQKLKHHELIDSYLQEDLERSPRRPGLPDENREQEPSSVPKQIQPIKSLDDSYFTETLARIYVKQKRYEKALQIIKNLSLKYPEKNVYFADQIRFLEKLIINTKK